MSREAYQVPTGQTGYTGATGVVEGTTNDAISVTYICGDCNSRVSMKRGDQIRCKECGHQWCSSRLDDAYLYLPYRLFMNTMVDYEDRIMTGGV
ncbi:DNA-directed RNA polymerase I, II, and III subunit RPABC4 [[Emmonsia] crescens]|uniref:DNA-directed RNA polymerase I, II, and III subunit RPABC4 n=1 Tax=[Emmonsia] crescens TaxID=73230 RepID=A0A0G2HV30_9EURO|nr:DNA-directed RNA polymerase I, II, and III subunit RPABC4 [Emmonsia crescens UAMH 3008]